LRGKTEDTTCMLRYAAVAAAAAAATAAAAAAAVECFSEAITQIGSEKAFTKA